MSLGHVDTAEAAAAAAAAAAGTELVAIPRRELAAPNRRLFTLPGANISTGHSPPWLPGAKTRTVNVGDQRDGSMTRTMPTAPSTRDDLSPSAPTPMSRVQGNVLAPGMKSGATDGRSNEDVEIDVQGEVETSVAVLHHGLSSPSPTVRTPGVSTRPGTAYCSDATRADLPGALQELHPPQARAFESWPLVPLRHLCLKYGIKGMSKEKCKAKMALLLRHVGADERYPPNLTDMSSTRPSPGVKAKDSYSEGIVKYEGESLMVGDVITQIEAQEACGSGTSTGSSAAGPDASGGGVEGCAPTRSESQTKDCVPRLLLIIVADKHRHRSRQHQAQASGAQFNMCAVGDSASIWADIRDAFVDPESEITGILKDDPCLQDINPKLVAQPNISADTLKSMFSDVMKKWQERRAYFKHCGAHGSFWDSCQNDRDVYVFEKVAEKFPVLFEFCEALVLLEAQRDAEGAATIRSSVEPSNGLEDDEASRAAAKRKGWTKDDCMESAVSKKDRKETEPDEQKILAPAHAVAKSNLSGSSSGSGHAGNDPDCELKKWRLATLKAQSESAEIDLQHKIVEMEIEARRRNLEEYERLRRKIDTERAKAGGGDVVLMRILEEDMAELLRKLKRKD